MNADLVKCLVSLAPATPAACFAVLLGSVVFYFPLVAFVAFGRFGWNGVLTAALAAVICCLAASLALAAAVLMRGPRHGVHGVLLGMLFRMSLPLVAGVVLSRQGGMLAESGIFGLIMAFYLFTLAVETWLSVSLVSRQVPGSSAV